MLLSPHAACGVGEREWTQGLGQGCPEQVSPRPSSSPGAPHLSVAALSPCLAPDMKLPKGVKNPVFYGQQPEKKVGELVGKEWGTQGGGAAGVWGAFLSAASTGMKELHTGQSRPNPQPPHPRRQDVSGGGEGSPLTNSSAKRCKKYESQHADSPRPSTDKRAQAEATHRECGEGPPPRGPHSGDPTPSLPHPHRRTPT